MLHRTLSCSLLFVGRAGVSETISEILWQRTASVYRFMTMLIKVLMTRHRSLGSKEQAIKTDV